MEGGLPHQGRTLAFPLSELGATEDSEQKS